MKSEQIFWVQNNILIQKHKIEYVSDKSRHKMAKKFGQVSKFRKQIQFGALDYFAVVTSCFSRALNLKYVDIEVPQNCNKQKTVLDCTEYTFIFKASGKSEEAIRKNTLAEEFRERPEVKRCKIDVSPTVGTSSVVLCNLTLPLPTNILSMYRVQSGSSHFVSISVGEPKREKRTKKKNTPTIVSGQNSITS